MSYNFFTSFHFHPFSPLFDVSPPFGNNLYVNEFPIPMSKFSKTYILMDRIRTWYQSNYLGHKADLIDAVEKKKILWDLMGSKK